MYIIFSIVFFVSLFVLYVLAKHDFVLMRKDISVNSVFDNFFLFLIFFFLGGRAFFIFDSLSFYLINPLAFLHIFKFPGFSVFGSILGVGVASFLLSVKKKNIAGRLLDIFSLAYYPIFMLSIFFISFNIYIRIICLVMLLFAFYFLIVSCKNYFLRDGSVSLIIFNIFSIISIYAVKGEDYVRILKYFDISQIGAIFSIFAITAILILNQTIFLKKNA